MAPHPTTLIPVERRRGLLCAYARPAFFKDCSSSADVPLVASLQEAAVAVHLQGEVLVPAPALHLHVKEDPGVFLRAEGDVRQEVHESGPIRLAAPFQGGLKNAPLALPPL